MLILGAAMLMAPEASQETGTEAPPRIAAAPERADTAPARPTATGGVVATQPAGVAARESADRPAEVASRAAIAPTDLDGAVARAAGSLARTQAGGELQVRALTVPQPEQPSLETLVMQARAEGNAPSLSDPASLGSVAISAETQGLIARIEATEPDPARAQASRPAPSTDILYVTGTRVNLRAGPSTGNAVVGSVGYGDAVELLDYANESWAQIRVDDEVAYMSRRFLSPEPGDG